MNQINYAAHEAIASEIEVFLAKGGRIKEIPNTQHAGFVSPCFDKSKNELQKLAAKEKRATFNYYCDVHGIGQHKTKNGECVRCAKKLRKGCK